MEKKSRARAVERLYGEHAERLLSFLVYRTGDRVLAEDLVAETFERALRSKPLRSRHEASQKAWLFSTCLNCLHDHARKQSAEARAFERSDVFSATEGSPDASARLEVRDLLSSALEQLSAEEREAISLRFGADLSVPEIAEAIGEPLSTAEGRVYRGLRKMRRILVDKGAGPERTPTAVTRGEL